MVMSLFVAKTGHLPHAAGLGSPASTPRGRESCHGLGPGAVGQTESEWSQLIAMLELAQLWEELIGEVPAENALPDGAKADDRPSLAKTTEKL
jgi:hypothetical protein